MSLAMVVSGFSCGGGRANPAGTGERKSAMITAAAGGTIEVAGCTLVVPANGLAADTEITVTSSTTPAPSSIQALSPMYTFEPKGLNFAIPARVTIKRTLEATRGARIYWSKIDAEASYEGQPSNSAGDLVSSSVTHFSNGFVGESTGSGTGGGSGGGGGGTPQGNFTIMELDPAAREALYVAADFDSTGQRVGVAYFTPRGTTTMMGRPDYDLKYVEYNNGTIIGPETLRYMQTLVGLDLKFDPTTGEPVVAYLGGAEFFIPGESIYWFQSDAVISRRAANGTWTETIVATDGDQVTCGNPVSDRGFLVGLWPALTFDSTGKLYFAYRDGHGGQFPQQDWAGSDVELFEGDPPSMGTCLASAGNNKQAYGGHNVLALGPGNQPALIYDQMFGTADSNGNNVLFQKRNANGSWTSVAVLLNIANTQTGAALAYDATEGFGVAVLDRATNELSYIQSTDGTAWTAVDPVFGAGSGGWYPALAMDPMNHEPAIAYYICSPRSGVNEQGCTTTEDELRLSQRIAGSWREIVVDREGGYMPRLGFFGQRRVVVYRHPPSVDPATGLTVSNVGALKLAVENP